jgi:hypothetical protein
MWGMVVQRSREIRLLLPNGDWHLSAIMVTIVTIGTSDMKMLPQPLTVAKWID